jgi:transcriptional regulator with XRE-family HTH domain
MPRLFGAKLRYLRESSHLTQVQLAERLGILQSHISHLEAGRKNPLINLVVAVSMIFNVTTDYLLIDSAAVETVTPVLEDDVPILPVYPSSLGQKVRDLRIQRHLQQREIADELQLQTQAFISLLETGRKHPSTDLVVGIAAFFGVTTDFLLLDK